MKKDFNGRKKKVIEAVPVENGMVDVHIRNNGPEIQRISGPDLQKFYTTSKSAMEPDSV